MFSLFHTFIHRLFNSVQCIGLSWHWLSQVCLPSHQSHNNQWINFRWFADTKNQKRILFLSNGTCFGTLSVRKFVSIPCFYFSYIILYQMNGWTAVLGYVANIVTNVSAARKEFQGLTKNLSACIKWDYLIQLQSNLYIILSLVQTNSGIIVS